MHPLPPIGAHLSRGEVLTGAALRGADVVQVNLSAPQNWERPRTRGDEEAIASSGIPVWVHAPYLVNPASVNPELRAKSRACLEAESEAAAAIGAQGLVVHGGHPTGGGTRDDGIAGWLEVLTGAALPCRVLIENTAGGTRAVARYVDDIALLFAALRREGYDVGFVLDTCHAHAAGENLVDLVTRLRDAVGVIDLVHANDSRDVAGCGRDRHENLGAGLVDPDVLVAVIAEASAPVVVETPGGVEGQSRDIEWLRQRLAKHHRA